MNIFACEAIETVFFPNGITESYPASKSQLPAQIPHGNARYVKVEIREDILHQLIGQRGLLVEDLRGLDQQTCEAIRVLLLNSMRFKP